jgi:lysophospholipase L1-like esterase
VRDVLLARHPELRLRFANRGIGGDTVRELQARWQSDALDEQPDWLSVMIGINDVWRAFGSNPHQAVPIDEYETTLRDLLTRARAGGARLIIGTPYMIEGDRSEPMRQRMDEYAALVRQIAAEFDAPLFDTQAAFDAALAHTTPDDWADDQIHPNSAGHMVIALAWLRAAGIEL